MLQVIKTPTKNIFMSNIKDAKNNIILCAPFVKKNIVKEIINSKQTTANMILITSSSLPSFVTGASDVEAIEMLISNRIQVINHQQLHAKIYLFDKAKAIITSANLTHGGLNKNYEYGVLLDDIKAIEQINNDLDCLIKDKTSSGEFSSSMVDEIKNNVKALKVANYKITTDKNDDEIILVDDVVQSLNLKSWLKDIYDIIEKLKDEFNIQDVYRFEPKLQKLHPNNKHIKDKIRQTLQYLRDRGLIKFVGKGQYKKLVKKL